MSNHRIKCDAHKHYSQFAVMDEEGNLLAQHRVDRQPGTIKTFPEDLPPGTPVTLRSGGCGGAVVASTTTNASGLYQFTGVLPGNYCVSVSIAAGNPGTCPCGGLCMISGLENPRTTSVSPGGTVTLDFGFQMFGPC